MTKAKLEALQSTVAPCGLFVATHGGRIKFGDRADYFGMRSVASFGSYREAEAFADGINYGAAIERGLRRL